MSTTAPVLIQVPPTDELTNLLSTGAYPRLRALLESQADPALEAELGALLQARYKSRATRKAVKRTARLRYPGYDEVVLLRDISASGVRMLVPVEPILDLAQVNSMTLLAKVDSGIKEVPLSLVRIVGLERQGVDLACRFLNSAVDNGDLVDHLRSLFFAASAGATPTDSR